MLRRLVHLTQHNIIISIASKLHLNITNAKNHKGFEICHTLFLDPKCDNTSYIGRAQSFRRSYSRKINDSYIIRAWA